MTKSLKEAMRKVGTIHKDKTFYNALSQMIEEKTNSLLVVDDDGKLVGMLNTGGLIKEVIPDYLEEDAVAAHYASEEIFDEDVKKVKDSKIENFMFADPATVDESDSLMEVAAIAISGKQLRVPVVNKDGEPIGIITRTELKRIFGEVLGIEDKE